MSLKVNLLEDISSQSLGTAVNIAATEHCARVENDWEVPRQRQPTLLSHVIGETLRGGVSSEQVVNIKSKSKGDSRSADSVVEWKIDHWVIRGGVSKDFTMDNRNSRS